MQEYIAIAYGGIRSLDFWIPTYEKGRGEAPAFLTSLI